jgi:Flp pilus assembly protein TadG
VIRRCSVCDRRRSAPARSGPGRAGAAAVEFAVVGSVFVILVLGIIEIGRALMVEHLLTNAAREGARLGVVEGKSTSDITTATYAALSGMGISGDVATVEVNDNVADASTANPTDEITVLVSVPVSKITWLPVPKYLSGSLTAQYTLRRE